MRKGETTQGRSKMGPQSKLSLVFKLWQHDFLPPLLNLRFIGQFKIFDALLLCSVGPIPGFAHLQSFVKSLVAKLFCQRDPVCFVVLTQLSRSCQSCLTSKYCHCCCSDVPLHRGEVNDALLDHRCSLSGAGLTEIHSLIVDVAVEELLQSIQKQRPISGVAASRGIYTESSDGAMILYKGPSREIVGSQLHAVGSAACAENGPLPKRPQPVEVIPCDHSYQAAVHGQHGVCQEQALAPETPEGKLHPDLISESTLCAPSPDLLVARPVLRLLLGIPRR
mmetsp:Transcript_23692/g.42913  ORF Transcript_23692/g.42913 Transcript_23692/m.42913 type:complete len:279 (-) Transcript_23692:920-1756(-)